MTEDKREGKKNGGMKKEFVEEVCQVEKQKDERCLRKEREIVSHRERERWSETT